MRIGNFEFEPLNGMELEAMIVDDFTGETSDPSLGRALATALVYQRAGWWQVDAEKHPESTCNHTIGKHVCFLPENHSGLHANMDGLWSGEKNKEDDDEWLQFLEARKKMIYKLRTKNQSWKAIADTLSCDWIQVSEIHQYSQFADALEIRKKK